ncbi:MAG: EFR1 family ferrodoxin [Candidatus Muiribacteriota bacterium]
MKKIYYFSGTGNSLYVAQKIAESLDNTQLISIDEEIKKDEPIIDSDFAGIIYPVYCFGLPRIVKDFIEKVKIKNNSYFFSIATAGAPKLAPANEQLENILKKKSVSLNAGFIVGMPGNYIVLYGAPSRAKQENIFLKARKKIDYILYFLKEKKDNKVEKGFFLIRFGYLGAGFFYSSLPKSAKNFYVTDKCTGCSKCVRVCPVNNISLKEGSPQWGDKCEQCMACIQLCPEEAVEYGKKSIGRKRYKNPYVEI